jgi:glyoxalase family protein
MSPVSGRGLHHVTAIATEPARNLGFYRDVLGLRLEKRTVTHEDPGAYHLIYGQNGGQPGGHLTFFSWRSSAPAPRRSDETEFVYFAIDPSAFGWWEEHLGRSSVDCRRGALPSGEAALLLEDPDGLKLVLVGGTPGRAGLAHGAVPAPAAIRGLHAVALSLRAADLMAAILTQVLGYRATGQHGDWSAFTAHDEAGGAFWLHRRGEDGRARLGAGAIHHVAFRARDDGDQAAIAARLGRLFGIEVGSVKDRFYFRSIHFRGPDGILIEIATDGPGLLIDEQPDELGHRLVLPPGLAPRRAELLRLLPPLD